MLPCTQCCAGRPPVWQKRCHTGPYHTLCSRQAISTISACAATHNSSQRDKEERGLCPEVLALCLRFVQRPQQAHAAPLPFGLGCYGLVAWAVCSSAVAPGIALAFFDAVSAIKLLAACACFYCYEVLSGWDVMQRPDDGLPAHERDPVSATQAG